MFLVLISRAWSEPPDVRYSSVVQLKNVYSKNRLCVTTDLSGQNAETPSIYSTRPPFDDGWLWTIESSNDTLSLTRDVVDCGSAIALSNPLTGFYLATRNTSRGIDVVPTPYTRGGADFWRVICRGTRWARDEQIQLRNTRHGCYLTTTLEGREKETVNRFNVTCTKLSRGAVWKAAEGVYFEADQTPTRSDEL
jgi:hypothetical protein